MRTVLLDSSLLGFDMHNYNFAAGVRRDGPALGLEVQILVPRRAPARLVEELGAHACLSVSVADTLMQDRWSWRIAEAMDGGAILGQDLAGLDGAAAIAGAVVMVPTATPRDIMGLALAIERTGPPAAILLGFHHLRTGEADPGPENQVMGLHRYAINRLRAVFPAGRILSAATTGPLALAMAELLALPTRIYPHPVWYDLATPEPDADGPPPDGRPTVAVLGGTRLDKGGAMLADIARHASDLAGRMRLLVQFVRRYRTTDAPAIEDELTASPLVALRRGILPEPALLHYLETAAAVLLPYEPAEYRDRASGIFGFAVAMGCPVIVPAGTWMADQLHRGAATGLVVGAHLPFAYAAALRQILDRADELKAAAQARAPAWRARECGRRYLEVMIRDLQGCGVAGPGPVGAPPDAGP
ncbi:hypothetical protein STVA_15700 [Allostella vacuolata]|nr:hypothetical protein STVA_15700 [Stella vacuolata]